MIFISIIWSCWADHTCHISHLCTYQLVRRQRYTSLPAVVSSVGALDRQPSPTDTLAPPRASSPVFRLPPHWHALTHPHLNSAINNPQIPSARAHRTHAVNSNQNRPAVTIIPRRFLIPRGDSDSGTNSRCRGFRHRCGALFSPLPSRCLPRVVKPGPRPLPLLVAARALLQREMRC